MERILVVMGTRPEAIKLCPLIVELKRRNLFDVHVCSTGQHGEMLNSAMEVFGVKADVVLDVAQQGQSLSSLGARILCAADRLFNKEKPNLVLVQGDTASAFFSSLAAFHARIPVGHVEAGLRTYRVDSPFPEELYREAISLFATLHFAPTENARDHLLKEGREPSSVFVTGNTVIDALRFTLNKGLAHTESLLPRGVRLLILTAHRRENLGARMRDSFLALRKILLKWEDVVALCPLHPNPLVRNTAHEILDGVPRVRLIEPPELLTFHHLLAKAYLVITDSGGIQEEAAALGIPTLVTRTETERGEGVCEGILRLVEPDEERIIELADEILGATPIQYARMRTPSSVFGDGRASVRIADEIENYLN